MADNPSYKGYVPADLQKTDSASASAASTTPVGSYDKIIRLPLKREGKYRFWFTYLYEDEETKKVTEGPRSPTIELGFDIPNLTRPVLNLTLTQSYRAYGVKFDIDPLSVQEDIVVFESLSANFANPYIVYVGTSNNITIQTGSTAQRWVKVVVRDKWLDTNRSESAILTVTPLNPDPDTTFTVENPATTSASASIDPKDLSGFSLVSTITWSVSTDLKTAGYALRWSTTNPATGTPLWEYASVTGRTTNTFTATGLIPNTTYYYQVAATTPYDVVNWTGAASGTFIASDSVGTAVGALARLKSFLAIGGATGDLFKIGTGITQGINLSTVPVAVPTLTDGTYHGIILNKSTTNVGNNFWLTTGQFRVGNSTEFLYWNGTDLNLTGNIEATGGKFTGNVQLAIPTGGTTSGSLYAGASATSGARLRLNSLGLFAYDGLSADATVSITNDGVIDARKGYIGGWTVSGTAQTAGTISKNGTVLESNGNITLGDTTGSLASIVRLSSSDSTFRLWVGSQTASNAPFRVDKTGKLTATGATFTGSTIDGYATTAITTALSSRLTTVEGGQTTLTSSIATKNAIFVQGSQPTTPTKVGDIWIHDTTGELKTWTGTVWTKRTDTTYATKTALDTKLEAGGFAIATANNQITDITSNGIVISPGTFKINPSNGTTTPASGAYLVLNSTGMTAWDGTKTTFAISSSGNASFAGNLSAATGSFSGSVTATSGKIGGFTIGSTVGDLTASTNPDTGVSPRLIFGNKVYLGWSGNDNYLFRIGNPYSDVSGSFRVQTITNVNRISVDTSRNLTYAAEITNDVRARDYRYVANGGLVNDTSSRRFKENITYAPKSYYDRVLDINPAFYTYKHNHPETDPDVWGMHGFGPIVEDLEDAGLGMFVQRNLSGQPTSLKNEQKIPMLLIPIVRELKEKINIMEQKILDLESR